MITRADVERLLGARAPGPPVLSLYLRVLPQPRALRRLPARAAALIAGAAGGGTAGPGAAGTAAENQGIAQRLLEVHAREWPGHTIAVFASAGLGMAQAFPLPCGVPDRAVIAARPHVRPLLAVLQRHPSYYTAVAGPRLAWVFRVSADGIDRMIPPAGAGSVPGAVGWESLAPYRLGERVGGFARQPHREIVTVLELAVRAGEGGPFVVGGDAEGARQLLGMLPEPMAERLAGTFTADPETITAARMRDQGNAVVEGWAGVRERRLVARLRREQPAGLAATGLDECLAAANQRAAELLIVPEDGLVPGFVCQRCGVLSRGGTDCPDGGAARAAVPDLIEEMAVQLLGDGGQVETAGDPPGGIAAGLRLPLAVIEESAR